MTDSVSPALDDAEREIRRIAQEAFDELVQRIRAGEVSRDVIAEIQARFGDQYKGALASAFTEVLGRSISSGQVAALSLGKVSLSRRLYENSVEVSSQVRQTIERHSAGMRDARKLALDIFEGYGFKGGQDPLKVRAGLPKYLKELLADRELGAPLEQLYRRINASVARTQPLKAAYLQAVDSVLDRFGGLRLEKALKVAQFERNRYFANRIAQTELHRAHTDRMASEILADGDLEVVQLVLSSTHPRTDICDMHARVDKFGLGPGCYPKALAPKPPFHPFCRCLLRKRFDLSARGARERGGIERDWLIDQGDQEAARVMGGRRKLREVLDGAPWSEVYYRQAPGAYKFSRLGDARALPLIEIPPVTPPPAPPVAPAPPAPVGAFDELTPAGQWHAGAWRGAPDWILAAVRKEQEVAVQQRERSGAWASTGSLVDMDQKDKAAAKDLNTWRHEFGHILDWRASGLGVRAGWFRSMSPDYVAAMSADSVALRRASGFGVRAGTKADIAAKALRTAEYESIRNQVIDAGSAARPQLLRELAAKAGLDFDRFISVVGQSTSMLKFYGPVADGMALSGVSRLAHAIKAVELGDGEMFIRQLMFQLQDEAGDLVSANLRGAGYATDGAMASLSDLFGAATKNVVANHHSGFYGHSTAYYGKAGHRGTETFANLTALAGHQDPYWWEIVKRFTPEMARLYEEIIRTWPSSTN